MRFAVSYVAVLAGLVAGCAHHPKPAATTTPGVTTQYGALYNKPLTSLGAKYSQLTPAAQTTLLAEAGSAEIYDVVKKERDGMIYYVITFRDSEVYPTLYIAADGSVLRPDLSVMQAVPKELGGSGSSLVSTNDLSPEVLKVMHERAPGAEVESIARQVWGDHTLYVVTFKDEEHHPKLHITAEGSVVYSAPHQ